MKRSINFKLIALVLILACPFQNLHAVPDFLNNRINQALLACAAVGTSWALYTAYKNWYSARLEKQAIAFMDETEGKYNDIFVLYNQLSNQSEQYKYQAFIELFAKSGLSDAQFSHVIEQLQQSITQIDTYLNYLKSYKKFESTCNSLILLRKNIIEIKETITRMNEFAQTLGLIETVENRFSQEYLILSHNSSAKEKKHAMRDLIVKSKPKTDLKYVAYNQHVSQHLQRLHNCLRFSIFNTYYKPNFMHHYDTLNKQIQTLERIQEIVFSSHKFQLEEEIQNLRNKIKDLMTQIKDLNRRNEEQQYTIGRQQNAIEQHQRQARAYQREMDELNSKLRNAYNEIHYLKNQHNSHAQRPTNNPPPYNPEHYNQHGVAKDNQPSTNPPAYNPEFYNEDGTEKA